MAKAYITVAEDLEWLRDDWWSQPDKLTDADVRRGGATLRRLLLDGGQGAVVQAWRHFGLPKQPIVCGPDVEALLDVGGNKLELTATLIAGGGRVNGIDMAMIGIHRVDNPSTGVPADADEGFAVAVGSIARDATGRLGATTESELDVHLEREWPLSNYLDAPGAIRRGAFISRRDILQFFCKLAGSVHLDRVLTSSRKRPWSFDHIEELEGRVRADRRDGLLFEVLSMGQAMGRSDDLMMLAAMIREAG